MKLIWLYLIINFTMKVYSKSIQDYSVDISKHNSTKSSNVLNHNIMSRRGSLFPSLIHRGTKFEVSPKPVIKRNNQENKPVQRKPLMRKLQIKNINHKDNIVKITTTRKPLMSTMKFTRKPHHVYPESNHERHAWNSNSRFHTHNSGWQFRNKNNNYKINKEDNAEEKLDNSRNMDQSNETDADELERDNTAAASVKSKIFQLFPKLNKKTIDIQNKIPNSSSENILDSEGKLSSYRLNNQYTESKTNDDNLHTTPKDQAVAMTEKTKNSDKPDLKEFILVGEENKTKNESKNIVGGDEVTTESHIEILDLRPKRSVNIIEEEIVATSFPRSRITSREFPVNYDFKFKNIHL